MRVLEAFSAEDFFPTGGWIIDAMSGLRAKRKKCFQNLDGYFQMVIDDHLDPTRPKPEQEDLVDVFIRLLEDPKGPFQFTNDHIKAMLMVINFFFCCCFLGGCIFIYLFFSC